MAQRPLKVWPWMFTGLFRDKGQMPVPSLTGISMAFGTTYQVGMTPEQADAAAQTTAEGYDYAGVWRIPGLKYQDAGQRGLMMAWPLPGYRWDKPLDEIQRTAPQEFAADTRSIRAYFDGIKRRGVGYIDRIILDFENHYGLYSMNVDARDGGYKPSQRVAPLYADPALRPGLGTLTKYKPGDFDRFIGRDPATFTPDDWMFAADIEWAFDSWASRQLGRALKAAVYDTAAAAFGKPVPVTNYYDWFGPDAWRQQWFNGIRVSTGGVYNESSPPLYLSAAEYGLAQSKAKKSGMDPRWHALIDMVNVVRGPASLGRKVVPWVSAPDYISDQSGFGVSMRAWWKALIYCTRPFCDEYLLWNYPFYGPSPNNILASDVFASVWDVPRQKANIVKIPDNAKHIDVPGHGRVKYDALMAETDKWIKGELRVVGAEDEFGGS
jgi:hypothetical protein